MSVRKTIKTALKDTAVLQKVCQEAGYPCRLAAAGQTLRGELWNGTVEAAAEVKLPEWAYPVFIKEDGTAVYDNHDGAWGKIEEIDKLTQLYTVEASIQKLRQKGMRVLSQQTVDDGSIRITVGR